MSEDNFLLSDKILLTIIPEPVTRFITVLKMYYRIHLWVICHWLNFPWYVFSLLCANLLRPLFSTGMFLIFSKVAESSGVRPPIPSRAYKYFDFTMSQKCKFSEKRDFWERHRFRMSKLLYKSWPPKWFFQTTSEVVPRIILKRKNWKICEHSNF